jgi:hypothetical protein
MVLQARGLEPQAVRDLIERAYTDHKVRNHVRQIKAPGFTVALAPDA